MAGAATVKPNNSHDDMNDVVAAAMKEAKTKYERLRHLKERNENYLAERNDDDGTDDDHTREL